MFGSKKNKNGNDGDENLTPEEKPVTSPAKPVLPESSDDFFQDFTADAPQQEGVAEEYDFVPNFSVPEEAQSGEDEVPVIKKENELLASLTAEKPAEMPVSDTALATGGGDAVKPEEDELSMDGFSFDLEGAEVTPQGAAITTEKTGANPSESEKNTGSDDGLSLEAPAQDEPLVMHSSPGASDDQSVSTGDEDAPAKVDGAALNNSFEAEKAKGRMGDQMVEMGLISADQLHVALQQKKLTGEMLGTILVDLGFIDESDLIVFLAETSGFGVFDPKTAIYDSDALKLLDKAVATKCRALPVSISGNDYYFAMADPYDVVAVDTIRQILPKGSNVRPLVAAPHVISGAIDSAYGFASSVKDILRELEEGRNTGQKDVALLDEKEAFSHPIVRLVNALVFEAVKMGVSDLHFEPEENFIRLRYRLDGVLFTAQTLHKQHWSGISQRLKIMSNMDIADKISPQDGRFNLNIAGREADFRVSSLPTVHGENIVLRVLDKSASIMPLSALGFSDENKKRIKVAQSRPEGIIIVTGPTGSGKTTSLYSMLNEINDVEVNIQTLEDPVEYSLPMIRQTHVREGVLEFADGIKALLRQDPDIIFIGEIRDKTTAEMALKAAMTGHQVYTSLHTNDSFGAIPRLMDLGMKPGMLAGAITAVFAQRLARRLCPDCKEEYEPTEDEKKFLGLDPDNPEQLYQAHEEGCPGCAKGYKGRVALAEILLFDDDLNALVAAGANVAELRKEADRKSFKNMADDGVLKIREGLTDISAISKVVDISKVKGYDAKI